MIVLSFLQLLWKRWSIYYHYFVFSVPMLQHVIMIGDEKYRYSIYKRYFIKVVDFLNEQALQGLKQRLYGNILLNITGHDLSPKNLTQSHTLFKGMETLYYWRAGRGGRGPRPLPSWQFLGSAKMKRGRRFSRIFKVGGEQTHLGKYSYLRQERMTCVYIGRLINRLSAQATK